MVLFNLLYFLGQTWSVFVKSKLGYEECDLSEQTEVLCLPQNNKGKGAFCAIEECEASGKRVGSCFFKGWDLVASKRFEK